MSGIERYITIREAMEILGIRSRTSFDKICREMGITKHRFGRSVRVRLSQLQDRAMSAARPA